MRSETLFTLSGLTLESIKVAPAESAERLVQGHAMTELAGSGTTTICGTNSAPSFVLEDDLA